MSKYFLTFLSLITVTFTIDVWGKGVGYADCPEGQIDKSFVYELQKVGIAGLYFVMEDGTKFRPGASCDVTYREVDNATYQHVKQKLERYTFEKPYIYILDN